MQCPALQSPDGFYFFGNHLESFSVLIYGTGLPPAQTATATLSAACLDGTTLHASSAPHFMAGSQQLNNDFCSGPPSVADLVVEPPAILTADLRSIAGRLPEQQTGLSHPLMGPGNATPSDRIASRVSPLDVLKILA